jgi:hypothetical protein
MQVFAMPTVLGLVGITQCNACNAAPHVYDLGADWSSIQNPNGPWSYRQGDALLVNSPLAWAGTGYTGSWPPAVTALQKLTSESGSTYDGSQRAYGGALTGGGFYLFQNGDMLFVPSTGGNVLWTAPAHGTISISGGAWACRPDGQLCGFDLYTVASWSLTHNGAVFSGGQIVFGDGDCGQNGRNSPVDFTSGSGGSAALQNISVASGDQIVLEFGGYPVVLHLAITFTPNSVDPITAIEDLAITVAQMNLQNGIANSLDAKLDAALGVLIDLNANNDVSACNSVAAFISAVQAQRGKKITNVQADQLIATAQDIKTCLNCAH